MIWALRALSVTGLAAGLLGACSKKEADIGPFFEGEAAAFAEPECASRSRMPPGSTLEISLSRSPDVENRQVAAIVSAARAQATLSGITLEPAGGTLAVLDLDVLFDVPRDQVEAHLADAGLKLTSDDPRVTEVMTELVGRPVRDLLAKRARPGAGRVEVVILRDVVSERSVVAASITDVRGLTFSPYLDDAESLQLRRDLALPDHSPVVFLSARKLGGLSRQEIGALALHEIGHALGLSHVEDTKNLMAANRRRDCLPVLDLPQIERMSAGLDALHR